ncbi:neurogenic locus notch homolog protein 1-like isoform X2 [Ostrea edulis]|uniref:neurogenic locus notch homolog protein 1-like isoform X2 n=1 Tax=Ostrea edulis TaxID=37623 RepID=UPI0024AF15B2|nr:neurogenic locus notch homolog protein 1-like isoform X2 [Ostrea edulis]
MKTRKQEVVFVSSKMKWTTFLYIQVSYFIYVQSYDQLVRPGVTRAVSSSVAYEGYPNKTVDGDSRQSNYTYCMHTTERQTVAWLRADLGRVYNLRSVKIWYRNDNPPHSTKRLQGFSIRLSNTPTHVPSDTCYQDPGDQTLPAVLERECRGAARYVWFYTNRDNGGGVFLEICEVEIFGCNEGYYGKNCSFVCGHCAENATCDVVDGSCPSKYCEAGWKQTSDRKCNQVCKKGLYGSNCAHSCGHCQGNKSCHHVNGSCPNGHCKPGWKHTNKLKCDEECDDGRYGLYCGYNCSGHCAGGQPCRKRDGVCADGCKDGWTNSYCNKTCEKGSYGRNCSRDCGHCQGTPPCYYVNGSCPTRECKPGWKQTLDRKCDQACEKGSYGDNCSGICGHCKGGVPCDHLNGSCPSRECEPGWKQTSDRKCDQVCENGSYGPNCHHACGHCKGEDICDHVNGSCHTRECDPGWKQTLDRKCDLACEKGSYDDNCSGVCGHCKGGFPCDHVNGSCPSRECEPGWKQTSDRKCDQVCENGSYGPNCHHACGHCKGEDICDHVNGSCRSRECDPGWKQTSYRKCDRACEKGSYGDNCSGICGHCKGGVPCDHVNGSCPSRECEPGWKQTSDRKCDHVCEKGSYGANCSRGCGHCKGNDTCDHVNGSCPTRECEPGWKETSDRKCDQACAKGFYGANCSRGCGHCKGKATCDHVNGSCPSRECEPGWKQTSNRKCNKACAKGSYGTNCSRDCGHCKGKTKCDHVNGSCASRECKPGWKQTSDLRCDQSCDDQMYGKNCMKYCSGNCAENESCHKTDGQCPGGCADGWRGKRCSRECKKGYYGRNCSQECGHCAGNKTCNPVNGSCPGSCQPGWQQTPDQKCNRECKQRFYGRNCSQKCGYCAGNKTCNHVNGSCPGSCQPGWQETSDQKCNRDQLVRPRVTEAVSSSVGWGGYPNKTVDGDKTQNPYTYCMHTATGQREAWLRVDLGDIYNLKSVKIWYRNDNPPHNTKRLQGFSIRLSNTTIPVPSDTCYQDPDDQTLPVVLERKCGGEARYVWFYTNRNNNDGVFLEICEVEVFGCQSSYYGRNCSERCGPCGGKKRCDNINGSCPGSCEPGYKGPKCKTGCKKGFYGTSCSQVCGHCAKNATCDHVTGSCPSGYCAPGWKHTSNRKCDQECDDGRYGLQCKKTCSGHCAGGLPCRKTDGVCTGGCTDGWTNSYCNKRCKKGFYGTSCSQVCGHCAKNATCDHVTGSCPSGYCAPGWKHTFNRKCDQECDDGRYALQCKETCSGHCAGGLPCRKTDGVCTGGCTDGWTNSYCNKRCKKGFYGTSCSQVCGHCAKNATCDHVTGSCPSGYCAPGWKHTSNRKCNQECDDGRYGLQCKKTCSGHCVGGLPCRKTDGVCTGGCTDGWTNSYCNKTCEKGFYGPNCLRGCGHCKGNAKCDHVDGSCPSRKCKPGWKQTSDRKCDQACEKGFYGPNCTHVCGHCKGKAKCDHVNGSCPSRKCKPGWKQTSDRKCDQACEKGLYGPNCIRGCGHCKGEAKCDHVSGSCSSRECKPGWKQTSDRKCDQACEKGFYGPNCTHVCGHCKGKAKCDHVNGSCPSRKCKPGWKQTSDRKCDQACQKGYYGLNCRHACGHCKGMATCDLVNGSCPPEQCEPGWKQTSDWKCDQECDNGSFGFLCNSTCSEGCFSICNKTSGSCDQCLTGYTGVFCNVSVSESGQKTAVNAALAGGVVGLIVFVIATILLVVIITRKTQKKKPTEIELAETAEEKPERRADTTPGGSGYVEKNAEPNGSVQRKTLMKIADLGEVIKSLSMEENEKFNEEFKGIPYGEQSHIPCDVAKMAQNMPKNRYKTTFPYDHSRVVLTVSPENDYINGNYIKDTKRQREYIATQGPTKNTVQNFWAMIWQENIRVIVMLTNLTEGSKIKCHQYWPEHGEMTSGSFRLRVISQRSSANYIRRDINITHIETNVVRTLNHMHYTAWPDHGTPSPVELLVFYRHVKQLKQMYPESLLVVHCSAGIGRTGTFIALDALYKQGQMDGLIDVVRYVNIMREDRMNMIQNVGQYIFLYNALNEIFQFNGRLLKKEQFIQEVTSQLMSNQAVNASYFKKEYNELVSIRPTLSVEDTKEAKQHIHLNMTKTVLPADKARTVLTSYVGGRGNYYNAVSISTYTLRDGLIAAQYPVEGAAIDLVRMLIDHDSSVLISFNQLSDIASSAEWFKTSAERGVISPYKTILGKSRKISENVRMTSVKMKHGKASNWHDVSVFEILNWKIKNQLPAETNACVELINEVMEVLKDKETKITVLSRDGATGCGVFCAIYNAVQQLKLDDEVDMFTVVRQLQIRRPEMISSLSEYQFCCKVAAIFFSACSDAIYENSPGRVEVPPTEEENLYANTSV